MFLPFDIVHEYMTGALLRLHIKVCGIVVVCVPTYGAVCGNLSKLNIVVVVATSEMPPQCSPCPQPFAAHTTKKLTLEERGYPALLSPPPPAKLTVGPSPLSDFVYVGDTVFEDMLLLAPDLSLQKLTDCPFEVTGVVPAES
jgi:hypothetical protein